MKREFGEAYRAARRTLAALKTGDRDSVVAAARTWDAMANGSPIDAAAVTAIVGRTLGVPLGPSASVLRVRDNDLLRPLHLDLARERLGRRS